MNTRTEKAGYPTEKEILECGFKIYGSWDYNDMGQATYTFNDYSYNDKFFLRGGYWNYTITDKDDKELWSGWFNTKQEIIDTIKELETAG